MARRNLTSKQSTKTIEFTKIEGHERVARVVIAASSTGKYHVREIWHDGTIRTKLAIDYETARGVYDRLVFVHQKG